MAAPPHGAGTARHQPRGLYDPRFEHDACGVGFVARIAGTPEHRIVEHALQALSSLAHRGAVAADGKSGDGAGVLTQIPRRFFARELARLGYDAAHAADLGVGMVFGSRSEHDARASLEALLHAEGARVAGWRDVAVDTAALGATARESAPTIQQVLVLPPAGLDADAFEQLLRRARKRFERQVASAHVCSLSCRTIVYKALCVGGQLAAFYPDLRDPLFETAFAIFHQRFSTNTLPTWSLAQPFRFLAHNGEINTLWANRSWMRVREADIADELRPVLSKAGSDSANLDEAFELLLREDRSAAHTLAMLVPPAWEDTGDALPAAVRDFYRAHAPLMEPWDGPAALAFSDGRFVGAALDRNGLRPCRYKITRDGLIVAGSEAGVLELDDDLVAVKGRLGPGEMIGVDLTCGRLLLHAEIQARHAARSTPRVHMHAIDEHADMMLQGEPLAMESLLRLQHTYGYSREDIDQVLAIMTDEAREPTWSMGDDTPIAPLARARRPVYDFFRQRFAQVTNPAIDPLRESRVMSLRTWLGPRPATNSSHVADLIELDSPVLSLRRLSALEQQNILAVADVHCVCDADEPLTAALDRICAAAETAVRGGARLVLLTDRRLADTAVPVPMALAGGAVHHHLIRAGLRGAASLVVIAGDCRDTHQLAVLLGYGADAVCPWLALQIAASRDPADGPARLIAALEAGVRKVMSKMGISTVASYRGGQTFEVLGLADDVVDRCFTGTPSLIGGLDFVALERRLRSTRETLVHDDDLPQPLVDLGRIRFRRHEEAEHHAWEPATARALQRAVGSAKGSAYGSPDERGWEEFRRGAAFPRVLRDLLDLIPAGESLPLEAVESAESIAARFFTSGMSLGALSPEAHRTLTIAMNRLGARSNSGEGGEDPSLYGRTGADRIDSKIKQVASGRFGVTIEYIAHADELEIKVAQGSKPGEGGQLGGHKVTELIASLRHTQPGMTLISPPPHHDIYSIEDLAQLIHDLKQANPRALVGVKLVAEAGVGTIAAGVAKAHADFVQISGHTGGTGASPLSSIKHAGSPWELGLAETQQVLIRNGLRSRIRLRTDGGLMTGRDVVIAALLGADQFGFGTAALVAMGCDMARQCHLDTCPTGIATQRPELRAKFRGRPEHVIEYFLGIAGEARELLAWLGLPGIEAAVGNVELLRQTRAPSGLDLSRLLDPPPPAAPRRCLQPRNDRPTGDGETELETTLERAWTTRSAVTVRVRNRDRSIGARLSGRLALRRGSSRAPTDAPIEIEFRGSAGQSFGAFAARGLRLVLTGEANDYVGKGLSGADLILRPAGLARHAPHENVILGNVALYGATSGRLFAAGTAGERFAIRNSGAEAVVEGVGDHACEYMTGGRVVILGDIGWNFGAGMTGGTAYVLDAHGRLADRLHAASVHAAPCAADDLDALHPMVAAHARWTGSVRATELLSNWPDAGALIRRVMPAGCAPAAAPPAPDPAVRPARRARTA